MAALTGLAGLMVPVVGGRWGSYIGIAPIFASDVLLLMGAVLSVLSVLPMVDVGAVRLPKLLWTLWFATVLFIVAEILLGTGQIITRLRDLLPWIYLLSLPAVVQWIVEAGRSFVERLFFRCLILHALWAIPAMLGVLPELGGGGIFGQPLFQIRADIDVPLLACAGVMVFYRWGSRLSAWVLAVLATAASISQTSRASLFGAMIGVAVFLRLRGVLHGARGAVGLFLCCAAVVVLIFSLVPIISEQVTDDPNSGALARAGLLGSGTAALSGGGTAEGRYEAWSLLWRYYEAEGYPLLGVGAGAEIVRDSGALAYLSGDPAVRAPHSWWIHSLVRTGPVGLGLWLLIVAFWGVHGFSMRTSRRSPLFSTGVMLTASVVLAATFGVVIESSFGSYLVVLGLALSVLDVQERLRFRCLVFDAST